MRAVVTGAASFIGSAVVRQLLSEGCDVCAVVRPGGESTARFRKMLAADHPECLVSTADDSGSSDIYGVDDLPAAGGDGLPAAGGDDLPAAGRDDLPAAEGVIMTAPRVRIVELDLRDIARLPEILGSETAGAYDGSVDHYGRRGFTGAEDPAYEGWDVFLHAGWEGAGSENRAKEDVQNSNVSQTIEALKAAARLGCRRFLFTGSQAEYGVCNGPADEDTPVRPVSPYGKAKVAVSEAALPLSEELGIEYVHARLYSVYGPGDHPWSLINSCLRAWKRGEVMELGPCSQLWNFLHVDDAAAALCMLLKEGRSGFYNVAGEDTRPLSDYIKEMAAICGAEGLYAFGDRPQNAEGAADLCPDISKIKRETSWRPKVAFREGISNLWEMEVNK